MAGFNKEQIKIDPFGGETPALTSQFNDEQLRDEESDAQLNAKLNEELT